MEDDLTRLDRRADRINTVQKRRAMEECAAMLTILFRVRLSGKEGGGLRGEGVDDLQGFFDDLAILKILGIEKAAVLLEGRCQDEAVPVVVTVFQPDIPTALDRLDRDHGAPWFPR